MQTQSQKALCFKQLRLGSKPTCLVGEHDELAIKMHLFKMH